MSQSQRPSLRRSARHAFDEEDIPFPSAKRSKNSKIEANASTAAKEKEVQPSTAPVNGAKKGAGKKGKAAYDEDDDGFQFSRAKPKKAKTPATVENPPDATDVRILPARRTKNAKEAPELVEKEREPGRRRSKRLSSEKAPTPKPAKSKTAPANGARRPASPSERETSEQPKQRAQKHTKDTEEGRPGSPVAQHSPLTIAKKRDGTKIALPFADTPVIKRNKALRKTLNGSRRSSSGMRGRRASSLIESGSSNAVPHADVGTQDFYKLIEQSIPEPRRMKQLLTWCGTRALPAKTGEKPKDATEVVAMETARHIQEELLKDFANKAELSDWFSREEDAPTAVLVKRPNPRNIQNTSKIQQLETEIKRLQDEKRAWDTLLSNPPLPPSMMATSTSISTSTSHADIDPTLLDDPSQTAILALLKSSGSSSLAAPAITTQSLLPRPAKRGTHVEALQPPTQRDEVQQRLRALAQNLEPSVDIFADGVHKLAQYRLAAERVADRVLAQGARVLEQRDRAVREASGTLGISGLDALRALGGILGKR